MLKKFVDVDVDTKKATLKLDENSKKIIGVAINPKVPVEEIKKFFDGTHINYNTIVYTNDVEGIQKFYEGDEDNWNKLQN